MGSVPDYHLPDRLASRPARQREFLRRAGYLSCRRFQISNSAHAPATPRGTLQAAHSLGNARLPGLHIESSEERPEDSQIPVSFCGCVSLLVCLQRTGWLEPVCLFVFLFF